MSKRNGGSNGRDNERDAKKAAFIAAFKERGAVCHACETAKVSRATVYRWREDDDDFAQAWEDVKDAAVEILEKSLYERGIGWEEDVFDKNGRHTGTRKRHDTTAAIFWLKGARPHKYRERRHVEAEVKFSVAQYFREADVRRTELARN